MAAGDQRQACLGIKWFKMQYRTGLRFSLGLSVCVCSVSCCQAAGISKRLFVVLLKKLLKVKNKSLMFFFFHFWSKNAFFDASKSVQWVEWAKVKGCIYVPTLPRNVPLTCEANAVGQDFHDVAPCCLKLATGNTCVNA